MNDNFDTGHGRKIHIGDETGITLCGYINLFGVNKIDEAWINQHDPDKNMCQKCKKIALKFYSSFQNKK